MKSGAVDVIITTSANMFYTVTLPVTLWFLDRGKAKGDRQDEVLFIDARQIFRQVSRAQRDFLPEQIEYLANIVRLWRGEEQECDAGSAAMTSETFGDDGYRDVPGLCRVATRAQIAAQEWSLNPGRYVGVAPGEQQDDEDFRLRLETMQEELETLNVEAGRLQALIGSNVAEVLAA